MLGLDILLPGPGDVSGLTGGALTACSAVHCKMTYSIAAYHEVGECKHPCRLLEYRDLGSKSLKHSRDVGFLCLYFLHSSSQVLSLKPVSPREFRIPEATGPARLISCACRACSYLYTNAHTRAHTCTHVRAWKHKRARGRCARAYAWKHMLARAIARARRAHALAQSRCAELLTCRSLIESPRMARCRLGTPHRPGLVADWRNPNLVADM